MADTPLSSKPLATPIATAEFPFVNAANQVRLSTVADMKALLAPSPALARTVIVGDSITSLNNATPVATGRWSPDGYAVWANIFLGASLDIVANAGVPGDRTLQIRNRFAADVLALSPALIIEMGGSNDIAAPLLDGSRVNGVDLAVLTAPQIAAAVEQTVAEMIANKTAYYAAATATGARVIACAITPSSGWLGFQHARDIWARITKWQRQYCLENPGMLFVDTATPIVDPAAATSVPRNIGVDNDGLHYYHRSAQAVGAAIAAAYRQFLPLSESPLFVVDVAGANNPGGNVIPNSRYTGTGGTIDASVSATGTLPDGWQINGVGGGTNPTVVLSTPDHPTIPGQKVLQVQVTLPSLPTFQGVEVKPINPLAFVGAVAGDLIDWDFEFRIVAANDNALGFTMITEDFNGAFSLLGSFGYIPNVITLPISPMANMGRFASGRRPYALGTGTTFRYFKAVIYNKVNTVGTITFQLGRLQIRKRI